MPRGGTFDAMEYPDCFAGVELFHWNPLRPSRKGFVGKLFQKSRVNNFGDLLGPVIVREVVKRSGRPTRQPNTHPEHRLFSIGSVLHFAADSDTVWGTGVNGKIAPDRHSFNELDIRAVRGPLTREFLRQKGIASPKIFGDPGLLINDLWGRDFFYVDSKRSNVLVVPNLNDFPSHDPSDIRVLNPQSPLEECIQRIASSDFVVGSSLHGIIIAEAFGIPARLVLPRHEALFKYEDYYRGSGRIRFTPASSVQHAIDLGGELPLVWNSADLLKAFPHDLWLDDREHTTT